MRWRFLPVMPVAAVLVIGACSDSTPSGPKPPHTCSLAGGQVTLSPLQAVTLGAADLPDCLTLPADGGTYIVVPQFATLASVQAPDSFLVGSTSGATARVVSMAAPSRPVRLQRTFDAVLRAKERAMAARVPRIVGALAAPAVHAAAAPPPLGSTRTFQVTADLDATTFKTDTAVLKYVGTNILFYIDQNTAPPPDGISDAQIDTLGDLIDQTLYGIDVRAFGPPTDIDRNGRVIVLMSPIVNAITPSSTCATEGFVAGFFFGGDLDTTFAHSNKGELYYTIAPDSLGTVSCAHTVSAVEDLTGATFLHEVLHMINFGQKVLIHGLGTDEVEFLDEGMAKIAEELGARYYEQKFPPPAGRTNPSQLFPDSAESFISEDLFDSYDYLLAPSMSTATLAGSASTLNDAGAEWLFLRWLGDLKDSTIFTDIVQSAQVGIANIEAQAGEPFAKLFGDFALAPYTDSLVEVPRASIPVRDRYQSYDMRQLYAAFFQAVGGPNQFAPRPFPITTQALTLPGSVVGAMLPGTAMYFRVTMPASGAAQTLRFTTPSGGALATTLDPQVSVFRCPSASACP